MVPALTITARAIDQVLQRFARGSTNVVELEVELAQYERCVILGRECTVAGARPQRRLLLEVLHDRVQPAASSLHAVRSLFGSFWSVAVVRAAVGRDM